MAHRSDTHSVLISFPSSDATNDIEHKLCNLSEDDIDLICESYVDELIDAYNAENETEL